MVRPIAIAAGGTGGHFFPAEALAEELIARGHRIVLMTDARSSGLNSPVFAGRERFVLHGAGVAGRGVTRSATALLSLSTGTLQARRILKRIVAGAVVGFGGYPSVAPALAALTMLRNRPSVILHEQNAVLGRANRLLAARATALALSFEHTERVSELAQTVLTGNPVRPSIAALAGCEYEAPGEGLNLLVLGGSLGARVFSDIVPAALASLPPEIRSRISLTQQCRAEDLDRVLRAYAASGIAAELAPFFPDIARRLAAVHLVIARAGASTVAELAVAGRPAILVPLPGAIDDHQSANARALAETGGAWVISQANFASRALGTKLIELLNHPAALAAAAKAARALGRVDAAARLADLVEALMKQEARA